MSFGNQTQTKEPRAEKKPKGTGKSVFSSRTVIGIVCIVLALLITFGVAPLVNRFSDQKVDIIRLKAMMNNDGKIIANYKTGEMVDAQYPIPTAGECIFFYEVEQARKEYAGKEVQFLVAFKVYIGNDVLEGEELEAEYQRLADLGYKLYHVEDHWTYRAGGVKEYIPIVVGLFTEDQLANFEANEMYGYTFCFETNGDGSAITVDEENAIANFNTNVA